MDQDGDLDRELLYWTRQLEGSQPAEFLCDKSRPVNLSGETETTNVKLDPSLDILLEQFCKAHDVTASVVLLAALRVTHYRLTGISDATIGKLDDCPRSIPYLQCIRIRVEDDSFEELVHQVQSTTSQASANQNVPLHRIASHLQKHTEPSCQPLLRIAYMYHSQLERIAGYGQRIEQIAPGVVSAFDVQIHIFPENEGILAEFIFSKDLYDQKTIDSMMMVFKAILERGLKEPKVKISRLPLLTSESHTILQEFGLCKNEQTEYPRESSLIDIFRHQVATHPDRVAVKDSSTTLTYAQLDHQSDNLAYWLAKRCFAAETLVGVYANRSCQAITAFLGILKANLAYLPLDVKSPLGRTQIILSSIKGHKLVLLGSDIQPSAIQMNDVELCAISEALCCHADEFDLTQLTAPSATSLAYAMFTSGSTGKPKGVMVEHRGIVRLVKQNNVIRHLPNAPRMAHMANVAFDGSTWEIYAALMNGGTLVCIDPMAVLDYTILTRIFAQESIQTTFMTPALFKEYLVECPAVIGQLTALLIGGDRIGPQDVFTAQRLTKCKIINGYGPTENTACSTFYYVPEDENCINGVPIGRAVSNSGAYIMDAQLRLVPLGVIGELVVTGDGLARGYYDPELDSGRFAFVTVNGQMIRAYRTGDYARCRPRDGELEFFGRIDAQIKIRGHRVELGDIEHALIEHRYVRDAAVVVQKQEDRDAQLVAYVTIHETQFEADAFGLSCVDKEAIPEAVNGPYDREDHMEKIREKLCERLNAKLPSYMVPTSINIIDKMPINANGKVDRCMLAKRFHTRTTGRVAKRQPRTQLQRDMQRIWGQVLGFNPVSIGLDDRFFQLGGDSLGAMKVVSRARKAGIAIAVADIFRDPVLEHVAACGAISMDDTSEAVPNFSLLGDNIDLESLIIDVSTQCHLDPAAIQDVYPCTTLQEGLLSLSSKRPGDYILQSTLELSSKLLITDFRQAWEETAQKMDVLRTRIVQCGQLGLLQVVLNERLQWSEATGLNEYLQKDRARPMEMGQPLARYAIIKDGHGAPKWFVWTIHHSLYDGWSLPLVLDAVERVYFGKILDDRPQFKTFIKYLRQRDDKAVSRYWGDTLVGYDSPVFPSLPPAIQQPVTDMTKRHIIPQSQKRRNLGVTTSNLIRAAWALVVGQLTDSKDVVFGCTVSGRNAPVNGIDEIAAPTIATVPIRVRIANDQLVVKYLQKIQSQSTDMIPFEQAGLQHIAKICSSSQQACKFQTLLIIQPEKEEEFPTNHPFGKWQDTRQTFCNTYALELEVQLGTDSIAVTASFDSRAIEPWTVSNLLGRLEAVLQFFDNVGPKQILADMGKITQKELSQLWTWNGIVPVAEERCVHEMVQERVRSQPQAIALCAWDGELTYGEMDRLATNLASHLVGLGIAPGMLVPLCFEKSIWTTIGMLGVLKAGGSFVLLDPSLPEQRLRVICGQVKASIVLSSALNESLSLRLVSQVIKINSAFFSSRELGFQQQRTPQCPQSIMYVIFTSGSTGTPKGVMITHRNIASAIRHQVKRFGFTTKSRVFDFSSYSFDVTISNLFATLVSGGCVCIPSDSDRKVRLAQSIVTLRADVVDLTPSVARMLQPEDVPQVETIILSGEAIHINDMKHWWGKAKVLNVYGPAECTATSTINNTSSSLEEATRIGTGAGQVTWVVDPEDCHSLVPLGCIGELLLEGPLVGLGYLEDPEKTVTAFINDPAWLVRGAPGQPGRHGRLYKTGDLVRYNEDGSLTFIGRKDTQVKIRGQRVELSEVEHHVQECIPDAAQVVAEVITLEGCNASITLAVFIRFSGNTTTSGEIESIPVSIYSIPSDVYDELAGRLPSYMVPTVFFSMRELPITASGKMDRKQLREIGQSFGPECLLGAKTKHTQPDAGGVDVIVNTEQPAFALAQWLSELRSSWGWEGLACKGDTATGIQDGFTDVFLHLSGLDSVNMMSLVYFISQQFHVKVEMALLMDRKTTIRSLAGFISDLKEAAITGIPIKTSSDNLSASINLMEEIRRHDSLLVFNQQQVQTKSNKELQLKHSNPQLTVLLTGSNGFIGTQILRQLLEHKRVARVIALVRGETAEDARSRTVDAAMKALWWSEFHGEKLEVWQGDLSLPHLGLDGKHWDVLENGILINAIIHNGATVHWAKGYAALEAVNVGSTMELLRLAVMTPTMRFVHVTGGRESVAQDEQEEDVAKELSAADALGYSQTKFVAEAVVKRAALRLAAESDRRITIVSPGCVIGTPTEGVANADDYIWRLVAASIKSGICNMDVASDWIPLTDAASTATTIVDAALEPRQKPCVVTQAADGMTWESLWVILEGMGYKLEAKSTTEWLVAVREGIVTEKETHPLWPLAHMLDSQHTQASKKRNEGRGEDREISARLKTAVKKSVEFLGRVGFLPLPAGASQNMTHIAVAVHGKDKGAFFRSGFRDRKLVPVPSGHDS